MSILKKIRDVLFGNPYPYRALSHLYKGLGNEMSSTAHSLLEGTDPHKFEQMYQKSFVSPVMEILTRQMVPQIKTQFFGDNQWGGSGLNQALQRAIQQAVVTLQQPMMNQYNLSQDRRLNTISTLLGNSSAVNAAQPRGLASALAGGLLGGGLGHWSALGQLGHGLYNSFGGR